MKIRITAVILGLALLGATAGAARAVEQGFLWDGTHWAQASTDGKIGYIFGLGNLADFDQAVSKGRSVCISRAFVEAMKGKTINQVIQIVDQYYQKNPDKGKTSVLEVILRTCTDLCPPESKAGGKK